RFLSVRKQLGLTQAEMAEKLGMSPRSYRMYETGDYDDAKSQTPLIKAVIIKVDKLAEELSSFPEQKGDNASLTESLAVLRSEMKEIKDRLLSTIESQTRIIESLTNKS